MNESDIADGMALWQEHRPQTADDWLKVAMRFIEAGDDEQQSSPMFAALVRAVRALRECTEASGEDLSDGFPTLPLIDEYAVLSVKLLRADYDDDTRETA